MKKKLRGKSKMKRKMLALVLCIALTVISSNTNVLTYTVSARQEAVVKNLE